MNLGPAGHAETFGAVRKISEHPSPISRLNVSSFPMDRSLILDHFKSPPLSAPRRDCVAMHGWPILVISSGARDLAFSATCEEKISRLWLEMTIATKSRCGAGEGEGNDVTRENAEGGLPLKFARDAKVALLFAQQ